MSDLYIKVKSASSVGATLMKTGQTTSYRTGDDGNLQEGRNIDFFTLPSNNPFGNTNRFTDELGGQTYTNDIVIDWSTYDGSTVLGYYRIISPDSNWDDAIDNAQTTSIGTYTSGWYLPNIYQLQNIACSLPGLTRSTDYSPFNITYTGYFWSSTTDPSNTLNALVFYPYRFGSTAALKTNVSSRKYIPVRNFTINETTLT